jgi:ribosomal protein S18 acetylase RimI-like enzyme
MSDKAFSLVCESRQNLIGFLTVCNGQYHHLIFSNNKISIIKAFLLRPWLVFHPEILRRCFNVVSQPDVPDNIRQNDKDIAYGVAIGVHHNYRRTGLAFTLLKEMIRKCYERKWMKIRVVIYENNVASRRMMKKLGFIETLLPGTVKIVSELNIEETHHLSDIC